MTNHRIGKARATAYIQVVTTTSSRANAEGIAQLLVEQRLAACVQVVGPVFSRYRWRGKVETAREWLCLIKTRSNAYPEVEAAIRAIHPYEVPEILAVPVVNGYEGYLRWMGSSVRSEFREPDRPGKQRKTGTPCLPLELKS